MADYKSFISDRKFKQNEKQPILGCMYRPVILVSYCTGPFRKWTLLTNIDVYIVDTNILTVGRVEQVATYCSTITKEKHLIVAQNSYRWPRWTGGHLLYCSTIKEENRMVAPNGDRLMGCHLIQVQLYAVPRVHICCTQGIVRCRYAGPIPFAARRA